MLTYSIDHRGAKSKTEYLYECIKGDILTGQLKAGERLPSKRELAAHLGISVITTENAYLALEEEGYVTARPRSGFYVNRLELPKKTETAERPMEYLNEEEDAEELSSQDAALRGDLPSPEHAYFPAFARIMRRILSERPDVLNRKPPHLGCAVLRNAIADYLRRYRGMNVLPSHIVIGSGSEYLYSLIVQLLGRSILYGIEDPSYEKIERVYRANGAQIERLQMGEDGIPKEVLKQAKAKVLHITPFHSYPTGITASAEKRYEYIAFAEQRDALLVEDDFDSEFASARKPIETLFSMDRSDRVIYMNTFSKSIAPSMRIGYMILPEALLTRFQEELGFYSCTVPVFDQYVLAEFIRDGSFERHLNRMRRQSLQE